MANNQNVIHKYKYLKLKIATIHEDIKFNKTCIENNYTPNFVQLHTKSKSTAAQKALEIGRKVWLKEEINSLYKKLNSINTTLSEIHQNFQKHYHQESMEEIDQFTDNWIQPILKKKKDTHIRKLNKLGHIEKNASKHKNIEEDTLHNLGTTNLTNIEFEKEEIDLLDKCLKYNINLDNKRNTIEEDLINIDAAIRNKNKDLQEPLRHNFIHELNKTKLEVRTIKYNKQASIDMKLVQSISNKLNLNNALITKADKGNTTVVIKKEEYINKMDTFILNNKFKKLNKDPTSDFIKTTNTVIMKCKTLSKIEQNKLKMMNPKAPTLRGLPKLHKKDYPIRPIVNFRNAPTYNICKFLNNKIQNNIRWNKNYSIKNTCSLVNEIKHIEIPNNTLLLSFDVSNMYTNIPIDETLKILKQDLNKTKTLNRNEIEDIIKLTKTTVFQNYFEYNSNYYQQEDGLAMGSPLSGLLANIFMHNLESQYIMTNCNPFENKIIYWYRYVDDVICLFQGQENETTMLLEYLNSLSNQIKFTMECQKLQINFLDLTISKENGHHSFNIYRKPTHSELLIPSTSNHPWQHKMAAFHTMINRLLHIPLNKQNYDREKDTIKNLAIKNGYKQNIIEKIIRNTKKKLKQDIKNVEEKEKTEYMCVPYNNMLNKATRNTFSRKSFKLSYRTRNNTFKLIQSKTTTCQQKLNTKYEKSGLYKLNCSDCKKYYIGQTGRNFTTRFKEHIQALKSHNNTTMKSTFAEHLLDTNHNYKSMIENMTILDFQQKGIKMDTKEDFYIYKNYKNDPQNMLNTTHVTNMNPIFEKIIQLT